MIDKLKIKKNRVIALIFILMNILSLNNSLLSQHGNMTNDSKSGSCNIHGYILDAETLKPINYATISIYRSIDSALVNGSLTKNDGKFTIENISEGKYYVKVKYIGYQTNYLDNIKIQNNQKDLILDTINLEQQVIVTQGISVEADKDMVSYNLDKKVFIVDKNLTSSGGTAADVLQNIPSVSIDANGGVSLRGNSNINVLIDGKPASLMGYDKSNVFDQLPSDNIESIEVITNPSAKYDPDGISGIINIVLKKNKSFGYNGLLTLNVGTLDKYSSSVNFNFKNDVWNFFTSYDNRFFTMHGYTNSSSISKISDTLNYLYENQNFSRHPVSHNLILGTDFYIDTLNSISVSGLHNIFNISMNDSIGYRTQNSGNELTNFISRKSSGSSEYNNTNINLSYRKVTDKKSPLFSTDFIYSKSTGTVDNDFLMQNYNLNLLPTNLIQQNSYQLTNNSNLAFQADFTYPIKYIGKIEAGLKTNFRKNDMDYKYNEFDSTSNRWNLDTNITNHFIYNENINSFYTMISGKKGEFNYNIGVRFELSYTKSNQEIGNQNYSNNYFDIFPSVQLKENLTETQSIQLSYSKRINRPIYLALNPFIDYSDPKNIRQGNPNLKPEYVNSFELGHSIFFDKTSISSALFYRYTQQQIAKIITLQTDGTTLTNYQNIDNASTYGLELILSQTIIKDWQVNMNYSYFVNKLNTGIYQSQYTNGNSWLAKISSDYTVYKGFNCQLIFNYYSPSITSNGDMNPLYHSNVGGLGKLNEYYSLDFGFKAELFDGKGTLNFRINDILKSLKYELNSETENLIYDILRGRESRIFYLSFSYKLNDFKKSNGKKKSEEDSSLPNID